MTVPKNTTDVKSDTPSSATSIIFTRSNLAFAGFVVAILSVGIGAGMYHPGAGLLASGLLLAVFSYLLGNE